MSSQRPPTALPLFNKAVRFRMHFDDTEDEQSIATMYAIRVVPNIIKRNTFTSRSKIHFNHSVVLKPTMATTPILINDCVGLPIIISDFDALTSTPTTSNASTNASRTDTAQPAPLTIRQPSTFSTKGSTATQQHWSTGFSDFADELWAKMTQGMKQKLRDACVEVLRKTEESEPEQMSWQYDDDARFLD